MSSTCPPGARARLLWRGPGVTAFRNSPQDPGCYCFATGSPRNRRSDAGDLMPATSLIVDMLSKNSYFLSILIQPTRKSPFRRARPFSPRGPLALPPFSPRRGSPPAARPEIDFTGGKGAPIGPRFAVGAISALPPACPCVCSCPPVGPCVSLDRRGLGSGGSAWLRASGLLGRRSPGLAIGGPARLRPGCFLPLGRRGGSGSVALASALLLAMLGGCGPLQPPGFGWGNAVISFPYSPRPGLVRSAIGLPPPGSIL